jgi:hypothetical protein
MAKEKYDSQRKVFIAVVSDLHIGSTVALCPPEGIELEDGGRYHPSQVQKWVWAKWIQFWADVKARAGMSPIITIVNGEFVDGNHHGTTQIGTPSPTAMMDAAIGVMLKPATMSKALYVTKGTAAHSLAGAASDHAIGKELGAVRCPETGQHAFYHLLLKVKNTRFDIAHHIGGSARIHTRGTNIRGEVTDAMLETNNPPDILIRSHVHTYADTGRNFKTFGVVTPAWQLMTEYSHRVVRRTQRGVGGLLFEVTANGWDFEPLRYQLPPVPEMVAKW